METDFEIPANYNADVPLKISIDRKKGLLMVGAWITKKILFKPFSEKALSIKREIARANGYDCPSLIARSELLDDDDVRFTDESWKEVNLFFFNLLGSRFNNHLAYISYLYWVVPKKELVNKYCFYSNGYVHFIDIPQLRRFWKHIDIVEQAHSDALYNIVPLCIFFGAKPCQLKKSLGKGLWLKLSKNSLTLNKLIIKTISDYDEKSSDSKRLLERIGRVRNYTKYIEHLSLLTEIKASLITRFPSLDGCIGGRSILDNRKLTKWVSDNARVTNSTEVIRRAGMYRDTQDMAESLNERFNPKWSFIRLSKEHDKLVYKINKKTYSGEIISWIDDAYKPTIIDCGVKVDILMSPLEIVKEGMVMGHCVANYIPRVVQKEYLLISIKSESEALTCQRSTLGLAYNHKKGKFVFNQHYAKYNASVEYKNHIKIVKQLLKNNLHDFKRTKITNSNAKEILNEYKT